MKRKIRKKKLLSSLAIVIFTTILLLLGIFVPKIWSSYEEKPIDSNKEDSIKTENIVEYPLEVEITEQDAKYFVDFFNDYSIGITAANINLIDEITQNEMIDFCRAILSSKYASEKIIPKEDIAFAIEKYFGVEDIAYDALGYTTFEVYEEYEAKKVFNVTKFMQLEKDSDIYLVYADCIDKTKVKEETYKKEDVEDVYVFTFKKVVEEKQEKETIISEINYVLQKVEIEVVEEPNDVLDDSNLENVNIEKE